MLGTVYSSLSVISLNMYGMTSCSLGLFSLQFLGDKGMPFEKIYELIIETKGDWANLKLTNFLTIRNLKI